jgi:hypothetical protein
MDPFIAEHCTTHEDVNWVAAATQLNQQRSFNPSVIAVFDYIQLWILTHIPNNHNQHTVV